MRFRLTLAGVGWCPSDVVARRIARGRERTDMRAERGRERTARTTDRHCHVSPVHYQLVLPPNKPDTCERAESIPYCALLHSLKLMPRPPAGEIPSSRKKREHKNMYFARTRILRTSRSILTTFVPSCQ